MWERSKLECHLAEHHDVVYKSKQSHYDLLDKAGIRWKKTNPVNLEANAQAVAAKKSKSNGSWCATGLARK